MSTKSIQGYKLTTELSNEHSGFAKWGFAEKGKKEYFIKEFLSPIYPDVDSPISADLKLKKMNECDSWERAKNAVYEAIRSVSNGNIVIPLELFREDSHYYLVTEKIDTSSLTIDELAELDMDKKLLIIKVLAHCLHQLAQAGVVHGDLKPDNLLIKKTVSGMYTVKLIDFDSSYLADNLPSPDDMQCDTTYMAPEVFLYMIGEEAVVDTKADVFAAGLIYHQYLCGELPGCSEEYDYLYEAVLDGAAIQLSHKIPIRLRRIIEMMLKKDPAERLSAEYTYQLLMHTNERTINTDIVSESVQPKYPDKPQEALQAAANKFRPSSDDDW